MENELVLLEKNPKFAPIKVALETPALVEVYENNNNFQMSLGREVMFAKQLIAKNDYLLSCTPESFYDALRNVVATGLTLNPLMQQAHLVPRKINGKLQAILDPDYKGLISIMVKSGIAKDVYAHVVYKNDIFTYDAITETVTEYVPYWNRMDKTFKESGEEHAVFCCVVRPDDTRMFRVLPISKVNDIMRSTQAYQSYEAKKKKGEHATTLWQGAYRPDMVKKTAIKNMWKFIPKGDNMMYHAMATAFEEYDKVNAIETNEVSVNDTTTIELKEDTLTSSVKNSIKAPKPRKAETVEVVEKIEQKPLINVDVAINDIADFYELIGEQRSVEDIASVKEILLKTNLSEEAVNNFLVENKSKSKTLDELIKVSSSETIKAFLDVYTKSLL